jgi:hypothetical protein
MGALPPACLQCSGGGGAAGDRKSGEHAGAISMTEPAPEMKLETIRIVTAAKTEKRISLLLCSPSGYGKTTLADSAPRKKLWLLFGSMAIASGKDVLIADFTRSPAEIVEKFEDENPFSISKILADNPEIETVVFDSVRAFGDLALRNVVHAARKGAISGLLSPGREFMARLRQLRRNYSPFVAACGEFRRDANWTDPQLVVVVKFMTMCSDQPRWCTA